MFSRIRTAAPIMLTVFALLAASCSVSPDKSKAFMQIAKRVQALEENQKKTVATVDTISYDLETVERDLQGIKTNLADATTALGRNNPELAEALKRVEDLERQIKGMSEKVANQTKAVELVTKKVEKNATATRASRTSSSKSASPRNASTQKSKARPTRLSDVPRRQPTGFYYKVTPGDTLQAIARRYDVSSAKLCRTNRIPATAALYPGQAIYVPRM